MYVCVALPLVQSPTKFLAPPSPPPRHGASTLLYAPARRMHVSAIIITRIPIVNYRSTRFSEKSARVGYIAAPPQLDPRHDASNACSYAENAYFAIILFFSEL